MSIRAEPQPDSPVIGAPRFDVRAVLGRGANGVVYRALDRQTGREVALKTLSSPSADQVYHLKAEFRALARIAHPSLVRLDELTVNAGACFFTMELLVGRTFRELADELRARGWTDAALERLADAALQLVSGISALHAAGKLHRDIKPTNVLVTDEGRAVLVDFGLCTDMRLVERARSPLVGTLLYMPPEQAWGKPLTPAADWYALGAVLYQAITGQPPFDARGSALLFAKNVVPRIPDALPERARVIAELACALMSPEPSRRPSPEAIAAALRPLRTPVRPIAAPTATGSVARRAELHVLEAALRDVERGRPAIATVEGASGAGKTELVERFLASAEERGAVAFRGRCHPRESVAYNGFDGVVDALSEWLRALPEGAAAELAPDDAGALRSSFPVLRRVAWGDGAQGDAEEPLGLRRRTFRALRQLLVRIAERHAVAILVDDAQWGGADTASLLADVFRAPSAPGVLLVLAYRSEGGPSSTRLATRRARAGPRIDTVRGVPLRPLADAGSRAPADGVLELIAHRAFLGGSMPCARIRL